MRVREFNYAIYEENGENKKWYEDRSILAKYKKDADELVEYYLNKLKERYGKNYSSVYIQYNIKIVNSVGIDSVEDLIEAQYRGFDIRRNIRRN